MNGQIVHNKLSMNLNLIPTLNFSVFLTQSYHITFEDFKYSAKDI